jgi:hypothetical protein
MAAYGLQLADQRMMYVKQTLVSDTPAVPAFFAPVKLQAAIVQAETSSTCTTVTLALRTRQQPGCWMLKYGQG